MGLKWRRGTGRFLVCQRARFLRPLPVAILLAAGLAGMATGCSTEAPQAEDIASLQAEKAALESEVAAYQETVERLEGELKELNAENGRLEAALSTARMDLEAMEARQAGRAQRQPRRSAARSSSAEPQRGRLRVVEASGRATERNDSWWRFGWVVTIANESQAPRTFTLQVQFLDADGYVVDQDLARGLVVAGGERRTFRDSVLIDATVAPKVDSVNPVIDDQV